MSIHLSAPLLASVVTGVAAAGTAMIACKDAKQPPHPDASIAAAQLEVLGKYKVAVEVTVVGGDNQPIELPAVRSVIVELMQGDRSRCHGSGYGSFAAKDGGLRYRAEATMDCRTEFEADGPKGTVRLTMYRRDDGPKLEKTIEVGDQFHRFASDMIASYTVGVGSGGVGRSREPGPSSELPAEGSAAEAEWFDTEARQLAAIAELVEAVPPRQQRPCGRPLPPPSKSLPPSVDLDLLRAVAGKPTSGVNEPWHQHLYANSLRYLLVAKRRLPTLHVGWDFDKSEARKVAALPDRLLLVFRASSRKLPVAGENLGTTEQNEGNNEISRTTTFAFTPGHYRGDVVFVDRQGPRVLCSAPFTATSSKAPKAKAESAPQRLAEDDLSWQFTRARYQLQRALMPDITPKSFLFEDQQP